MGVVCSPRVMGNTEVLVREALAGAREVGAEGELVLVREKNIRPCDGCLSCSRTRACHVQDDMQALYETLAACDGLILGAPAYWTICGQGAVFLDRLLPLVYGGKLANKPAAGVAVGARIAVDNVLGVFRRFFQYSHMFCVECFGAYGAAPGDVARNDYAMKAAFELGRLVALCVDQGKVPAEYARPFSNVVREKYGFAQDDVFRFRPPDARAHGAG